MASPPLQAVGGGASEFFTPKGCKRRTLQEVQLKRLRLRIEGEGSARVRVRTMRSVNCGGGGSGAEDAGMWLREKLPSQLESDGVEVDASRRIAEACADACASFLATGRAFDPMIIMDAMEEEIERRGLRGDEFLPFELGRKAAKVLTERWNALPVAERPKTYCQQPYVNKKDVVDFGKWPENLNLP
jgi:hypothetical protein